MSAEIIPFPRRTARWSVDANGHAPRRQLARAKPHPHETHEAKDGGGERAEAQDQVQIADA